MKNPRKHPDADAEEIRRLIARTVKPGKPQIFRAHDEDCTVFDIRGKCSCSPDIYEISELPVRAA